MRRETGSPIKSRSRSSRILDSFDDKRSSDLRSHFCIANEYQGLKPDYRPNKPKAGNVYGSDVLSKIQEIFHYEQGRVRRSDQSHFRR